jgi:2',3'-cyclic-nucleotide 2'-phosphodiesterase (5'-nucleotidase family)
VATTHLRIVAVSDVYVLDNLPRLATLVQQARAGCDRLVVALPGDFLAPSVLSSLDNGHGMVACLNAVGVTHVTFGNHEDDVPHRALLARIDELHAMWLGSNVHLPERSLPDHDILELGAVRVGMFGVVLSDPLMFRGKPFSAAVDDPHDVAVREVARLTGDDRCSWVVALTHQEVAADRKLAHDLRGRPVFVIGSHEHVPYDEVVDGIRLMKAGADATRAIIVDAVWSDPAAPPDVTARLEPVAGYAVDPAVHGLVELHMAPVYALAQATLLDLPPGEVLSSVGARAKQTSIGELVCSRIRDVLGADACVFNAGGIRAARDYHDRFTYGDLEAEVPFDNEIVIVPMPGRVLADAIASSRAGAPSEHGAFLQVDDGVRVDGSGGPAGSRITAIAGAPFDPARVYRVATVRELCFGLDRIEPLVAFAQAHPDAVPLPGGARTPKELLVRSFALALWKQLGGFAALDANGDGKVTPSELAEALARAHPGASALVADLVLRALDENHDGSVSADEASRER